MLFWIAHFFSSQLHFLRVFQYLTFQAIIAALTALFIVLFYCPRMIEKVRALQMGQVVRTDGPQSHLQKSGTPTMGGALILIAVVLSVLLWADLSNYYIWIALLVMTGFGIVGWRDDYLKIIYKNSKGLSARKKLLFQSVIALIAVTILYHNAQTPSEVQFTIPFFKTALISMGAFSFIALGWLVIVGSSNAVNLTDGLDGLATMPAILVMSALGCFVYLSGNTVFSTYLFIPHLPKVGELIVFCSAMVGGGLGFLWYNTYPAEIFMGDVGSLSIGGALGVVAVCAREELILLLMGGIFVVETLSVILQVASFKLRGKRIFKMAPLHHHFELSGWKEPKIIVRFWIITVILVLIGLATLKLR